QCIARTTSSSLRMIRLISKNDESAYREEVQRLTDWCRTNNLSLNVDKAKEMVVDFRRTRCDHSPLYIDGSTVEIVKSTKFLGVHLAEDLTWLRKAHLPPPILTTFYRGTIESILSSCITAWFGNCTTSDRKSLQRVVRKAEKIIGVSLPTITDIYTTRFICKANRIVDDHTHSSPSSRLERDDIIQLLESSNPTSCPLDPIPSTLLRSISLDLLPFIASLINSSLSSGCVPQAFKTARVVPILKKPLLDSSDINSYRPISLLSFLSKILERAVYNQLSFFLSQNQLQDINQSGFKPAHSTETALIAVTARLQTARSAKLSSVLILLDLSAVFDTVNHKILLSVLTDLGITGTAWKWFESYLEDRHYQETLQNVNWFDGFFCQQSKPRSWFKGVDVKIIESNPSNTKTIIWGWKPFVLSMDKE
ncbi:hypothetical protein NFI96_003228, partial [Prochilodus magdalenae]